MELIEIKTGNKTAEWKKTFSRNFFNRLGYTVVFREMKYLIDSMEVTPPDNDKNFIKYNGLFNYCYGLECQSFNRLQKIRRNKIK